MPSNYWIKAYVEILEDPKMATLPDRLWRRIMELFLLAGKFNKGGELPDTKQLAWVLRMSTDDLDLDMRQIETTGIIQRMPAGWLVINYAKRQAASLAKERMAQWRERQHQQQYYQDVTQPLRPVTQITDTESESDTEDGTLSLFGRINEAFYVSMRLPIIFNPVKRDVESINRMIKKGMTPEKIPAIVKECLDKGLTIVSPASIERPFYISEQKKQPKDDGYTE